MQYLKLRILAFFKGYWVSSLFRGEDWVGVLNLHGRYEIWFDRINKKHLVKRGGILNSKAGIGETFDEAVKDALDDYLLKRKRPSPSFGEALMDAIDNDLLEGKKPSQS